MTRRRAIRIGHRRAFRKLTGTTLAILFVAVGWLGILAYGQVRGIDWNQHKPIAWLKQDALNDRDAVVRDAALAEIVRRIRVNLLTPEEEKDLVEAALARQADWKIPWNPAWGTVIVTTDGAGRLSVDQKERYLLNAVELKPGKFDEDRRGLLARIDRTAPRLALGDSLSRDDITLLYASPEVMIGEVKVRPTIQHPYAGVSGAYRADWETMPEVPGLERICEVPTDPDNPTVEIHLEFDDRFRAKFPSGRYAFQVHFELRRYPPRPPTRMWEERSWKPMTVKREMSVEVPFQVPPPKPDLVSDVGEEEIRKSIRIHQVEMKRVADAIPPDQVSIWLSVNDPPVNVAFKVALRQGQALRYLWPRSLRCEKGQSSGEKEFTIHVRERLTPEQLRQLTIVLEPDVDQAELNPIWGNEIEIVGDRYRD